MLSIGHKVPDEMTEGWLLRPYRPIAQMSYMTRLFRGWHLSYQI
jgi:hypothetical protein